MIPDRPTSDPRFPRTHLSRATVAVALALCLGLTGCGGAKGESSAGASNKGSGKGGSAAVLAADDGPVKHEEAEKGEELFKAKGCSACHAFGKRITGPDLAGVSKRRTRDWIVRMAMHPDGKRIAYLAGQQEEEVWVIENVMPQAKAAQK